jgi:hypothetical protein
MSTIRIAIPLTLAVLLRVLVGCTSEKPIPPTVTTASSVKAKTQSLAPPTAEQAYRLQDDCSGRGEAIMRDNEIGSVLTQEQVSRYNPTTNRCYVRLRVHAQNLKEWDKYDNSTYLEDGHTRELLASFTVKAGGTTWFTGFGCSDESCVEEKVAACMSGKECEPE